MEITMVQGETLTQLVAERVGGPGRMSFDDFQEQAVEPKTGFRPSRTVLWKVQQGKPIMVSPLVVGAIAAGIGLDRVRVARAAARQYIGPEATDPWPDEHGPDVTVTVAHEPGMNPEDLPNTHEHVTAVLRELDGLDDDSNGQ